MDKQKSIFVALPVLFGFFVMGFCDIVGISSDYVQRTFNWSPVMTGFVPSLVFIWFLFLGIPVGSRFHRGSRRARGWRGESREWLSMRGSKRLRQQP